MIGGEELPLRLAIQVSDDELHARLAEILENVAGLELVSSDGGEADALIIAAIENPAGAAVGVNLMPRELEVLALSRRAHRINRAPVASLFLPTWQSSMWDK